MRDPVPHADAPATTTTAAVAAAAVAAPAVSTLPPRTDVVTSEPGSPGADLNDSGVENDVGVVSPPVATGVVDPRDAAPKPQRVSPDRRREGRSASKSSSVVEAPVSPPASISMTTATSALPAGTPVVLPDANVAPRLQTQTVIAEPPSPNERPHLANAVTLSPARRTATDASELAPSITGDSQQDIPPEKEVVIVGKPATLAGPPTEEADEAKRKFVAQVEELKTFNENFMLVRGADAPPANMETATVLEAVDEKDDAQTQPVHYGTKPGNFETRNLTLSHEQGSERSERASKQVSAAEGASEASSPEQVNE